MYEIHTVPLIMARIRLQKTQLARLHSNLGIFQRIAVVLVQDPPVDS